MAKFNGGNVYGKAQGRHLQKTHEVYNATTLWIELHLKAHIGLRIFPPINGLTIESIYGRVVMIKLQKEANVMLRCFGCANEEGLEAFNLYQDGTKDPVGIIYLCKICAESDAIVRMQWVKNDGTSDSEDSKVES